MLAIEDEKLPPPKPAVAAHRASTMICVECSCCASQPLGTTIASSVTGISSSDALTPVQARPPNFGTANVYGIRSVEPMRLGSAMSRNCSESERVKPAFARLMTTIVHSTQIEKPRFSAKMERIRFFLAILFPLLCQNASSSGSQSSSQRPLDPAAGVAGAAAGLSVVVLMRPPEGGRCGTPHAHSPRF